MEKELTIDEMIENTKAKIKSEVAARKKIEAIHGHIGYSQIEVINKCLLQILISVKKRTAGNIYNIPKFT